MIYKGTGTITTLTVSGAGEADFSQDMRAKTITNVVQLYAGATIDDPYGVVALTNGFKPNRCTIADVALNFGPNRTFTVA